jgi:hypothetical protein
VEGIRHPARQSGETLTLIVILILSYNKKIYPHSSGKTFFPKVKKHWKYLKFIS